MLKYRFYLKGLNCAGCAATIEQELGKMDNFTGVNVDFIDKELTLFLKGAKHNEGILKTVQTTIGKIEPDVEVVTNDLTHNHVRFRDSILGSFKSYDTWLMIIGLLLTLFGLLYQDETISTTSFLVAYVLVGWQVIAGMFRRLFTRYLFNEHLLMTIATLGAIYIGEYIEAIAVMLFYRVGKLLESKMIDYSQKSIGELLAISPEYANIFHDHQIIRTNPQNVNIGDTIIVKPGERVPLDCNVLEGTSEIDNSLITGESIPQLITNGDSVSSGAINLHSAFTAKVEKDFNNSTISRIIEIIKTAKSKKTNTERFITRFAAVYTPVIIALAVIIAALPPLLFEGAQFSVWFYRSLIFLVISCPCALVISVPLSFFSGLAVLVKKGVLIKGAVHIETLAKTKTVIVDKTGTITTGKLQVAQIIPQLQTSEEDLLRYAYIAEVHSNHPIATAVSMEYHRLQHSISSSSHPELPGILSVQELPGKGMVVETSEGTIYVGNLSFIKEQGIMTEEQFNSSSALIAVGLNDRFLGVIEFKDNIRSSISKMVDELKSNNVHLIMLTGDKKSVAETTAAEIGIENYYGDLSPEDKLSFVTDKIKANKSGKIVFIGDGINDAPAMAAADVGIAMGGIGAAVSIEAADVVLQTDEVHKLAQIITVSKKTLHKAKENIAFALGIKALFLIFGALGMVTIWGAVFADVGVTLIAVLNSLRLLKYRELL